MPKEVAQSATYARAIFVLPKFMERINLFGSLSDDKLAAVRKYRRLYRLDDTTLERDDIF